MTETTVHDDVLDETDGVEESPTDTTQARFARTPADTVVDVVVAIICVGAATAWTFNPIRRQFTSGTFSNFYELQARSFLDGHLAIDQGLLGIEAFIRDGNEYMYFGPLLSLFRVPVLLFTDQLDGRLTVISLLIGTVVLYLQSIKLLDRVLTLLHPTGAPTSTERWFRLGWRASVAAGTVVLTLLSIPWSYHEAHLWSAAMFIALLNQMLRFPTDGGRRVWVFGLILFTVVLNRPTTAYAGLIGIACLLVILLIRRTVAREALYKLAAWSVAAFAAMVIVNWAKFRRFFGIPMEDQFFTSVDANRAQMLEIYDNKYFQMEFIPSNLWAYFKPNGVDLSTTFPFVGTPRSVPWVWGDAFYDATYRTASVTATNPLFLITTIVGVVAFVMLFRKDSFWTLSPPVLAGLAAGGGVAGWGYISTRYLTDFLPGMLMLSAIGVAAFVKYVDGRSDPFAPGLVLAGKIAGVSLVVWAVLANLAIAFSYSFSVGDSASDVERLLSVQDAASAVIGPDIEDRVVFLDELPYDRLHPPMPGTLAIVGDCEALYYSNGEPVDTWIEVEYGTSEYRRDFEVTPSSTLEAGYEIELVRLTETADIGNTDQYWFSLVLVVDDVRRDENLLEFSLVMRDNFGELPVETLDIPLDEPSELSVTFDDNRRVFFAELDGYNKLYGHFDMDPLYDSPDTSVSFLPAGSYGGFEVEELTPETPWCDRLSAAASS